MNFQFENHNQFTFCDNLKIIGMEIFAISDMKYSVFNQNSRREPHREESEYRIITNNRNIIDPLEILLLDNLLEISQLAME